MVNADAAIHLIIPIFSIATMFAMGLETTFTDTLAPLRNMLAVGIIILVNNILIPLLGFVIIVMPTMLTGTMFEGVMSQFVPLIGGQGLGFLLLMLASGSLLAPALARIGGGSVPFAKGVMVVLAVATALLAPFELAIVCGFRSVCDSGGAAFGVQPGAVFTTLLTYQLLPLAVGIVIKVWYDALAVQIRPLFVQLTGLAFLVLLAVLVLSAQQLQLPLIKLPTSGLLAPVKLEVGKEAIPTDNSVNPSSEFLARFKESVGNLPENPSIITLGPGKGWALVNGGTTYRLVSTGDIEKQPRKLSAQRLQPPGNLIYLLTVSSDKPEDEANVAFDTRVAELNTGQISQKLIEAFEGQLGMKLIVPFNQVIPLAAPQTWALVDASEMYRLTLDGDKVAVSQDTPQPIGVVADFMTALAAIPVIGPVISFLTSLVTILLPYLLFAAVAALVMLLGRYGGLAVRSSVGVTGDSIPRAMAVSTVVRNVSVALLLADQSIPTGVRLEAIATIVVFYLVCLVVAGHQAVQWGKEPVAQPAVAPEPPASRIDVTSAPAV